MKRQENKEINKQSIFKFKRSETGFTVVELLVVLAIIGLLMVIVFSGIQRVRMKSRDVRRMEDMKIIKNALTFYSNNKAGYPAVPSGEYIIDGVNEIVSRALIIEEAVNRMPTDPLNSGDFRYNYQTDANGSTFAITYYLESDSIPGKSSGLNKEAP